MKIQQYIKILLSVLITISISYGVIYAWAGLTASDGDTLDYTKWNELFGIVDTNSGKLVNITSSGGNIGIGIAVPEEKLEVVGTVKSTDIKTTSTWYNLLAPSGWSSAAQCRKVNGWVEFKGGMSKSLSAGWPAEEAVLLPTECRPTTQRTFTSTICHASQASNPKNITCLLHYYPDGRVGIYSNIAVLQLRLEGSRFRAE